MITLAAPAPTGAASCALASRPHTARDQQHPRRDRTRHLFAGSPSAAARPRGTSAISFSVPRPPPGPSRACSDATEHESSTAALPRPCRAAARSTRRSSLPRTFRRKPASISGLAGHYLPTLVHSPRPRPISTCDSMAAAPRRLASTADTNETPARPGNPTIPSTRNREELPDSRRVGPVSTNTSAKSRHQPLDPAVVASSRTRTHCGTDHGDSFTNLA